VLDPDEQGLQIVFAGFLDQTPIQIDMIDRKFLVLAARVNDFETVGQGVY
jgi:hypothetical protein